MAHDAHPAIVFTGRDRATRAAGRAAVIALEGARPVELTRAAALASTFDPKSLLIAVDGGLATCRAARRTPDLFVGDLDSTKKAPRGIPSRIYPVEKDFSDFSGALSEATRMGASVAIVAGLLGGRLDHEWANLLELSAAAPRFAGLVAPTARGVLVVTVARAAVSMRRGSTVSVFALGGVARVSLRGARWTLTKRRIEPGSLGLSNVAAGEVTLVVHEGVAGMVLPRGRR